MHLPSHKKRYLHSRPAYPEILLSVLRTAHVRIFTFLTGFFVDAPPISQNEAVSKVNFPIIHLVRTVCELTVSKVNFSIIHLVKTVCEPTFSIIQTYYTRTTLFGLHLRKSFSIEDHKTLSQKQCTVCAAFADADTSFLEQLLSGLSLFPWFRAFFLLFVGYMQPLITDSFKPAISEDG